MATKLIKPVSREIQMEDNHGNVGPVVITMSTKGIALRGKGSKKRTFEIPWTSLKKVVIPPVIMPAKFSANSIGWLIEGKVKK